MPESKSSPMDRKTDALIGGREVTINLPSGGTENIFIRQIKASELMLMLQTMDDEPKFVSLVSGKDGNWIDNLSISAPDEYSKIAAMAYEVNMDFFSSWFRRRKNQQMILSGTGAQAK